jgi:hypothetical protein
MLRGALESVSSGVVSGWIYSPVGTVRDGLMLAFLDTTCVGAGRVEIFRQDLADAGLGDGYLGFSFPVTLTSGTDAQRLVVRLDGSDTVLLHRDSRVGQGGAAPRPAAAAATAGNYPIPTLQWMRARGWLDQAEYDFLRYFRQLGVYDRALTGRVERGEEAETLTADPALLAHDMLSLLAMGEVEIGDRQVTSAEEIRELHSAGIARDAVVALWSPHRGRLDVVEGSHQRAEAAPAAAAVDYPLGPERLLFLDTRLAFGERSALPMEGLRAFFVTGG